MVPFLKYSCILNTKNLGIYRHLDLLVGSDPPPTPARATPTALQHLNSWGYCKLSPWGCGCGCFSEPIPGTGCDSWGINHLGSNWPSAGTTLRMLYTGSQHPACCLFYKSNFTKTKPWASFTSSLWLLLHYNRSHKGGSVIHKVEHTYRPTLQKSLPSPDLSHPPKVPSRMEPVYLQSKLALQGTPHQPPLLSCLASPFFLGYTQNRTQKEPAHWLVISISGTQSEIFKISSKNRFRHLFFKYCLFPIFCLLSFWNSKLLKSTTCIFLNLCVYCNYSCFATLCLSELHCVYSYYLFYLPTNSSTFRCIWISKFDDWFFKTSKYFIFSSKYFVFR